MTPRTKVEKRVWELSSRLPSLSPSQRDWAVKKIDLRFAYVNKRNAWCGECGQPLGISVKTRLVDILDDDNKTTVCPHCGKHLVVKENSVGSVHYDTAYMTVVTTCSGYQVFRHFWIKKESAKNRDAVISVLEAVQHWIGEDGKTTIVARDQAFMGARCNDGWNFDKPMSVKHKAPSYYGYDIYAINPDFYCPRTRVIPVLKRNGFSGDFFGITPSVLASRLLTDPMCECLAKTNQVSMLKMVCGSESEIPYMFAVNICNRNKYIIKDASLWVDLLRALEYLGKDLHSPHYVCPFDLKAAHDKFIALKDQKEKRKEEEQRRQEARKWESRYRTDKEDFFSLAFNNGTVFVRPLLSVAEFEEEGTKMHHCVYARGYYKEKDSLILTARDIDGNRLETVEVSLKGFCVVQSRGVCNSHTDFHDQIVTLVNDNMLSIKKIMRKKKMTETASQVRVSA